VITAIAIGHARDITGKSVPAQMNVDLEARTAQDYDLTLDVTGPAERAKISYRSDPPLPTEEFSRYWPWDTPVRRRAEPRSDPSVRSWRQRPSRRLFQSNPGRLQRLLGLAASDRQHFRTSSGGPRVTIEEQVARDFTITYSKCFRRSAARD
jgi:hypothetical protein